MLIGCMSTHLYSYEAVPDVMALLTSLTSVDGTILVDGLSDDVAAVTYEEEKFYENVDFNPVSVW